MGYKRDGGGVKMIPGIKIISVYCFFHQQMSTIKGRARNDLERQELECTSAIQKERDVLY
jgi:hypothetical protein